MNGKKAMKHWKAGAIDKQLWSEHAQRGTVVIDTSEEAARAVFVDDHGGVRATFKVPPGQLAEVIGAAAQSWLERGAGGSFAVYTSDLKGRGELTPPPPPPPPPPGHPKIFQLQTAAGHGAFEAAVELARFADLGDLPPVLTEGLPAD